VASETEIAQTLQVLITSYVV